MAKEDKNILGIHASYWAVIIVLVVVGYFYRKDLKKLLGIKTKTGSGSDADSGQSNGSGSSGSSGGSSGGVSSGGGGTGTGSSGGGTTNFVLTSTKIRELQDLVNDARDARFLPENHDDISVDGVMGKQTTDALADLGVQSTINSQADYGLIMADLEAIIDYWS